MDLVNRTPIPASVIVSEIGGDSLRVGMLVAKATFRFDEGRTELDTQEPLPLFHEDYVSSWGLLPRDTLVRRDGALEVIVVGSAHAPRNRPTPEVRVRLCVGNTMRELIVWGDRHWIGEGDNATISSPIPYVQMPLDWAHAFGGTCEVEVDRGAVITVSDPWNPLGCGFDAAAMARAYSEALRVPPGYPRFHYERVLPNIEDPHDRITRWSDAPKPVAWATLPSTSPLRMRAVIERILAEGGNGTADVGGNAIAHVLSAAHPDWRIEVPAEASMVCLDGFSADGPMWFSLPRLRVVADVAIGDRLGACELVPELLVLLPDASRFYIVFRAMFRLAYAPDRERCFRLRLAEGWFQGAAPCADGGH